MPSRRSQNALGFIRSHKQLASAVSQNWIMKLEPPAEVVARMRINGTMAAAIPDLKMPALMIEPRKIQREDAIILHLHGGAYVSGGLMQCRALISPICTFSGLRALTFSYRLAPEFPYPAQLEDALRAYDYLLSLGYEPQKIVFVGESAGGNLALELALKLREEGRPLPAALALLSPWTDLGQTGDSYEKLRDVDATLNADELLENAIAFAGSKERLSDPDISPIYASFTGFPPTLIHCGTAELLLSDSEQLEKAMKRDGVDVQLLRWEGMCHVFQAFGFDESRASDQQIGHFLLRALDEKAEEQP